MSAPSLKSMEAGAAHAILGAAVEKLALVSEAASLGNDSLKVSELFRERGEEVNRVVRQQKELEVQFASLMDQRVVLQSQQNKAKVQENHDAVKSVSGALRDITNEMCHDVMGATPSVSLNMSKLKVDTAALSELLGEARGELAAGRTYGAMLAHAAGAEGEERQMEETIARERQLTAEVKELQAQLSAERKEHAEELEAARQRALELKTSLKETKAVTTERITYRRKEVAAGNGCEARVCETLVEELEEEADALRAKIALEKQCHDSSAGFLRARLDKLSLDLGTWLGRGETDVQDKDKQVEDLRQRHKSDRRRLREMEEQCQQEIANRETRMVHERHMKEELIKQLAGEEIRHRAAAKIQNAWRVAKANPVKGKKGKKGKGGKGKKKK